MKNPSPVIRGLANWWIDLMSMCVSLVFHTVCSYVNIYCCLCILLQTVTIVCSWGNVSLAGLYVVSISPFSPTYSCSFCFIIAQDGCFCVFLARVERERGLPSLPAAGPGLHLLLREEDSTGGAGEGLHVLQACKEPNKRWHIIIIIVIIIAPSSPAEWPLLALSFTILILIRSNSTMKSDVYHLTKDFYFFS